MKLSVLFLVAVQLAIVAAQSDYNLIFLDEATLLNNRQIALDGFYQGRYYKNEDLSLAVKRFVSVAKTALNTPRTSVTMKTQVPPSGDLHDYYSQAIYYWPNNYTRGGWPYVHRAGIVNPETELIPDSKNFQVMYNKFCQLALMYFYSNDLKYAEGAVEFIRAWFIAPSTAMNPNMNYASLIPGFLGVRGEGVIEIHEIVYMFDYLELIKPSGMWTNALDVQWRTWLTNYFNWLITNSGALTEATRLNNHGTYCALQLVTISLYLNNLNYAGGLIGNVQNLLDNQMGPDQSFPHETAEAKSWYYSLFNLQGFFSLASVAEQFGFDLWHYNANGNSLEGGMDFLVANYYNWPYPDVLGPPTSQSTNNFLQLVVKARQIYGSKYDPIYNDLSSGVTYVKHASQVILQYYLTQTAFDLSPVESYFIGGLGAYGFIFFSLCFYYFFLYKVWYKTADEIEEERLKKKAAAKPKVAAPSKQSSPKGASKPSSPKGKAPASTAGPASSKPASVPPSAASTRPPSPRKSTRSQAAVQPTPVVQQPQRVAAPVPVAAPAPAPSGDQPVVRRRRSSG